MVVILAVIVKKMNLSASMNKSISGVESSIKKENLNVILNLDDKIKIDGYPNELIQCLINIFNNAKAYFRIIKLLYIYIYAL